MNKLDFTFDQTLWEMETEQLHQGEKFSAARFLALLEDENDEAVEEAFQDLEKLHISLDLSDLPKPSAEGESALRLRMEEQLAAGGDLLHGLKDEDPLRMYLEELAGIPNCGDPDVLAAEAAAGDAAARNMLVNASLSRVVSLAQEYVGRGVLLLDLIQEGSLGLWQGILEYKDGDFSALRDWWIRQYLVRAVIMQARAGDMGQKMRQAAEDYRMVDERLLAELGRNPTLEEIGEQIHMSSEETAVIAKMLQNIHLINQVKGKDQAEAVPEEEDQAVEDTAYFKSRERIAELLSGLETKDAELLSLRFGLGGELPLTSEDTGRRLGMTPEEVIARETAALSRLRQETGKE